MACRAGINRYQGSGNTMVRLFRPQPSALMVSQLIRFGSVKDDVKIHRAKLLVVVTKRR